MPTDSAEAAYLDEQLRYQTQQDLAVEEWGLALLDLQQLVQRRGKSKIEQVLATLPKGTASAQPTPIQPLCEHCTSWLPDG